MDTITRRGVLGAVALGLPGCAEPRFHAGAPPPGRILLMPVHITLGERSLGGRFRLRPDWSEALVGPVSAAAADALAAHGHRPAALDDEAEQETAWRLARLHRPVAESLLGLDAALTGGDPVPTRGRPGLGEAGAGLAHRYDAPAALFVSVTGEYPDGVQRAAEFVVGEVFDAQVTGLDRRIIVSTANLRTGDLFWSGVRRDRAIRNPSVAARHAGALAGEAATGTARAE